MESLGQTPYCYWCHSEDNLSIKARRVNVTTYICKTCRNKQHKAYTERLLKEFRIPPKRIKNVGASEAWLKRAKESQERIIIRYGV